MAKYVGNLNHIIGNLIDKLKPGAIDQLFINTGEFEDEITYKFHQPLRDAGYDDPAWDGITYSPVTHFDKEIILQLNKELGTLCTACWISELKPGKISPPHIDSDRRTAELQQYGQIVSYSIHMGDPHQGHAFFVDNECYYNQNSGNTFKWDNPHALHCGSNCGLVPKFIMVYAGLILNEDIVAEYNWSEDRLLDLPNHYHKFLELNFTRV